METVQAIDPMTWIIIISAIVIGIAVLLNKAVKLPLKLAVIAVVLLFVAYFLVEAGILQPPTSGN
ncbi:MAG: hypothetical protein OES84_03860 [Kiritimatiellaceae bacterium]|nr:hypothetical protein [Kiritimatiellaceae bacterium]